MRWIVFLFAAVSAAAQPAAVISKWRGDTALRGTLFAVCVTDAATGQQIFGENENISVVPASTMKIFTTGAALGILGSDHTFSTTIAYTGSFDRSTGIISGDLLIVGGGDPSLQSAYFRQDVIKDWTAKLGAAGIKEIRGNIVGQAGAWPRVVPDHWIWSDISNYFGTVPAGLSFRDNRFSIDFTSGASGSRAAVKRIHPQYTGSQITVKASVTCKGTQDQAYIYGDPFGFNKTVTGYIPVNKGTFSIDGALPDPALLCAEELLQALTEAKIRCSGKAISEYRPLDAPIQPFFVHRSPPLATLVEITNQRSDNLYCESIFMALGAGNRDSATAAVKKYWASAGLDTGLLNLADGSGLSRAGTCTALLQCQALTHIFQDTALHTIIDRSLPRAGREGSMRTIGKGSFIEGNLRAKTGYIQRSRAYCGFLRSRTGKNLTFSVIFNNFNCSPAIARRNMEQLMLALGDL